MRDNVIPFPQQLPELPADKNGRFDLAAFLTGDEDGYRIWQQDGNLVLTAPNGETEWTIIPTAAARQRILRRKNAS